jgi:hypothetical protein
MKSNQTGRGLSRRLFLGGGAVAVGLPFFESVMPRVALADATTAAKRLIYFWIPNGVWMDSFRPTTLGAAYTMPDVLTALEPLRSDFSIVTGLNNQPAIPDMVGDHASGTSAFITCVHALKSETMISLGTSADQLAANGLIKNGIKTRIPSLQLGIDGGSSAGGCDSGYSCAYSRNISWADATNPLPKITDALQAFNQIFMGYDSTASAADVAKRQAYDKSVLDYVTADATSLNAKLGKTDQMKLDQYLSGVRALELELTSTAAMASCTKGTPPASNPDYPTHVKLMLDTMVLAFQCDATRVISFMLGNAASQQTYPFLMAAGAPIARGHHDISHHNGDPTSVAQLIAINTWTFTQIAYLLTKMKGVSDGAGDTNLLTNSAIFISSDISDGNMHNHDDMPIILAGHGGGALKPGTHIRYGAAVAAPSWKSRPASSNITVANLLLTMQQSVGVMGAIGDSTGILPEL